MGEDHEGDGPSVGLGDALRIEAAEFKNAEILYGVTDRRESIDPWINEVSHRSGEALDMGKGKSGGKDAGRERMSMVVGLAEQFQVGVVAFGC